jgi:hypothetical protein
VIAGPAIGAGLLVLASPATVFAVNATSFVISAALVTRIRTRSRPVDVTEEGTAGPLKQMVVGARRLYARRRPIEAITALQRSVPSDQLARVFGVFFAFVLGAISLGALITPQITSAFGLGTGIWTMAISLFAIGLLGYPQLVSMDRAAAARPPS